MLEEASQLEDAMRRRLEVIIPIVLFAVMVQLLAPIAAFRAVALASSDPLYMASICAGMTSSEQQAPSNTSHSPADCCAFCNTSHGGGLAIEAPPAVFVVLQLEFQRISWLEAAVSRPTARIGSNTQARAPPSIS